MQPPGTMGTAVPPDRQSAKSAVAAPAIILAIIAGLGILGALAGLALPQVLMELVSRAQADPAEAEKLREALEANRAMSMAQYGLMLVLSAVALYGSIQMMGLKSYGLAMTAAIVSMVPCVGPCCCLAIPFGIWALVVLMKPDVKAAFQ